MLLFGRVSLGFSLAVMIPLFFVRRNHFDNSFGSAVLEMFLSDRSSPCVCVYVYSCSTNTMRTFELFVFKRLIRP